MSRTDKTDPGWLQEHRYGIVEHDHCRGGECRVETLAQARASAARSDRHPRERCARYTLVEEACPGHLNCYLARNRLNTLRNLARWDNGFVALLRLDRYNDRNPFFCDRPHRRYVYDSSVPCEGCARREAMPPATCEHRIVRGYVHVARVYGDAPPPWFRRQFETTARADTRTALRNAARDYNTNGDTDIEPEPTRHRHNAGWYWW